MKEPLVIQVLKKREAQLPGTHNFEPSTRHQKPDYFRGKNINSTRWQSFKLLFVCSWPLLLCSKWKPDIFIPERSLMVSRAVQKTVQSTLKLMSLFHAFISDTIPYRKKENQITYVLFSSISNTIEVQGEEIAFPRTLTYCVRRNYLISYSLCVWTIILTDMVINNICEGIKIPGIITHSNEIRKDWKRRKRKTGRPQTTPKSNCLKFASL